MERQLRSLMTVLLIFTLFFSAAPSLAKPKSASASTTSTTLSPLETLDCSYDEALHVPSRTCYEIKSQGPCNEFERWFATSEDATEGECSCLSSTEQCFNVVNQPIARSVDDQRCYPVYSKANCRSPNEWFTFQPDSLIKGQCTPNPCANSSLSGTVQVNETSIIRILGFYDHSLQKPYTFNKDLLPLKPFWFLHKNKCVQTFTHGTCKTPGSNKTQTLYFKGTAPFPECIDADTNSCSSPYHVGVPTRVNKCPYGYRRVGKDCALSVTIKAAGDNE